MFNNVYIWTQMIKGLNKAGAGWVRGADLGGSQAVKGVIYHPTVCRRF